jgi:O-antigen/teichoic acid export membrane protein
LTEAPAPTGLLVHLRRLLGHSALYGAADVASQVINVLLTPLFVVYLSTSDNGAIALLLLLSSLAKLVFRMGLDSGFLRVYYGHKDEATRADLAGSVALFAMLAGVVLFLVLATVSPWIAARLIPGVGDGGTLVRLALADVYIGSFLFVPIQLLRVEGRVGRLAGLLTLRNALNTVLKVSFLMFGAGVAGVLVSDLVATGLLVLLVLPVMLRRARPVLRASLLREVMAFGLPKAPHGVMLQLLNFADRWILQRYQGLSLTGIYDKGYGLGSGVKFALSAFEPAWQPFVFSRIGQPDAPQTLARVATYVWLAFVACGLGVAVFGRELLMLLTFTNPRFWPGAAVVAPIVLAYLCHGAFLLTSIGVGIEKRTRYYPIMTGAAAATNLAVNFTLIPRYGMMGAAWATVVSYALMAVLGFAFSHRVFPIPFEWKRLVGVSLAGLAVFVLSATLAPTAAVPALPAARLAALRQLAAVLLPGVIVKTIVLLGFPLALWAGGFFSSAQLAQIRAWTRWKKAATIPSP